MKAYEIISQALSKLGSAKSGNWGHAGRPGKRGGSVSRSTAMSLKTGKDWQKRQAAKGTPEGWTADKYGDLTRVEKGVRATISKVGDTYALTVVENERRRVQQGLSKQEAVEKGQALFKKEPAWEKNMFGHYSVREGNQNATIRPPSKAQYRDDYELRLGRGAGRGDEFVKADHISRNYSSLKAAQDVAAQFLRGEGEFIHYQQALNMMRNATLPEQKKL